MDQKDFAEKVHVRPQSLGEMLTKMEENGLIVRKKDPADGRAILVDLTPAGEEAEQAHHAKVVKDIEARYAALTDDELTEYLRLTQKINETLEGQLDPE
ncbi:MAG: MarR family transcriptional regulator [Clostridia bacterium]|nr:MarR family transcriptional regulator [Clostridia bacterium]